MHRNDDVTYEGWKAVLLVIFLIGTPIAFIIVGFVGGRPAAGTIAIIWLVINTGMCIVGFVQGAAAKRRLKKYDNENKTQG